MSQFYNTITTSLSREFLEDKVNRLNTYIDAHYNEFERSRKENCSIMHPTQVYETVSNYIYGVIYNMLGAFCGHWEFIINPNSDTFEYQVRQHSYYGSLTYTLPARDSKIYYRDDLTDEQRVVMDGSIAYTLLLCTQHADEDAFRILDVMSKRAQMLVFKEVKPDTF